ncbi:MAG: bacillithiol biosynthesis cysteine-adding enzyme BshC [Acidobacteria bacterium]|nr:bacillithiol biosynthesis cysteine-adding enzyme BshC [Acidobacteriota bacterium]MBI3658338.1 bacillithiol biosynthesis cysteine-adding enzyme BshC [Acidobacteriota bacterium]
MARRLFGRGIAEELVGGRLPNYQAGGRISGHTIMNEAVSFAEFPEYTKLFLDFVGNFQRVSAFYSPCGHDVADLEKCTGRVLAYEYPRAITCETLRRQNLAFGAGERTMANIEQLRRPETVAVVTGQQVGLFGGPLLTLYKMLTAIKRASWLSEIGFPAVPVFWLPSEDHDFAEIATASFLHKSGTLESIAYEPEPGDVGRPVGAIRLGASIGVTIDRLARLLPTTEFSSDLLGDISEAYAPGLTWVEAFARLWQRILGNRGLIMLDPADTALKELVRPLFEHALREAPSIDRTIQTRDDALLAAGFHLQVRRVKLNTLLFCTLNGRRLPVRMDGPHRFLVGDASTSEAALLERLRQDIDVFSPNVLLRPLVQDILLPTAAYIGGPSEIAYYAQAQPLYASFGRPGPGILPRASFTLAPKKARRPLEKYRLSFHDLREGPDAVFKRVVESVLSTDIPLRFAETARTLQAQLSELETALLGEDPSLVGAINRAREKMLRPLETLKAKFHAMATNRYSVARAQIEEAVATLYPRQTSQERALNGFTFFVKYGYGLLDTVYAAIPPRTDHHELIDLE